MLVSLHQPVALVSTHGKEHYLSVPCVYAVLHLSLNWRVFCPGIIGCFGSMVLLNHQFGKEQVCLIPKGLPNDVQKISRKHSRVYPEIAYPRHGFTGGVFTVFTYKIHREHLLRLSIQRMVGRRIERTGCPCMGPGLHIVTYRDD